MSDTFILERYELTIERIALIPKEELVASPFREYFQKVATFLLQIHELHLNLALAKREEITIEELQEENLKLYADILPAEYEKSYANPEMAIRQCGERFGQLLSALYVEVRGCILYAYQGKLEDMTLCNELFLSIYYCFVNEVEPDYKEVQSLFYWHFSDYLEKFSKERVMEQLCASDSFVTKIIQNSDLLDLRYLYKYGVYVTDQERFMASFLNQMQEATIEKMARYFVSALHRAYEVGRKDFSKKKTVSVYFHIGFERVIAKVIQYFKELGLTVTFISPTTSMPFRTYPPRGGYEGGCANMQCEFDHKDDMALILNNQFASRRIGILEKVFKNLEQEASSWAGPALMEVFGEDAITPLQKDAVAVYSSQQEELLLKMRGEVSEITNRYIKSAERSFTIVAYPMPSIGEDFEAIFAEIIRINTLDPSFYERVQQFIIDALDEGDYVHIGGSKGNRTDLIVQLYKNINKETETIFENCVADENVPAGEVFTTPVLEGTNGVLHVSKVFLSGICFEDLELVFKEGMIASYSCSNYEDEKENQRLIKEQVLNRHDTLPMGEFAIGTNTTAFAMANRFKIEHVLPILIAEKMGPHFAVGDSCYSHGEDHEIFNPNGKKIVAKDNSCSIKRKENSKEAYFQCHTDITIPYDELDFIRVMMKDARQISIIENGRFVLPGTKELNRPFEN